MRVVIVDTDVVSFIFKKDTRGNWYEQHLRGGLGSVSFMTIAELDYWAASRTWGKGEKLNLPYFCGDLLLSNQLDNFVQNGRMCATGRGELDAIFNQLTPG